MRHIALLFACLLVSPALAAKSGTYACAGGGSFSVTFADDSATVTIDGSAHLMSATGEEGHWAEATGGFMLIIRGKTADITRDFKPYLSACTLKS